MLNSISALCDFLLALLLGPVAWENPRLSHKSFDFWRKLYITNVMAKKKKKKPPLAYVQQLHAH